jgi:hypothetical protein
VGKRPRTEFCRWHKGVEGIPSVFDDPAYEPNPSEPVVYHLRGFDSYPASLVLTEDDHLDFIIAVARDTDMNNPLIPLYIRAALADSSLLFSGYDPADITFQTIYYSLVKGQPLTRRFLSFIQLDIPTADGGSAAGQELFMQVQLNYFAQTQMQVYWGHPTDLLIQLQRRRGAESEFS